MQELKAKIFLSLDTSNNLEFVSNLNCQLQPPLHELALLGQSFIAQKFLGFFFFSQIWFYLSRNCERNTRMNSPAFACSSGLVWYCNHGQMV